MSSVNLHVSANVSNYVFTYMGKNTKAKVTSYIIMTTRLQTNDKITVGLSAELKRSI